MVPKFFNNFWFLHFHRLPCDSEKARVLYKIKRKIALCIRNLNCKSLTDFICHKLVSLTIYDVCLLSTVIVENSTCCQQLSLKSLPVLSIMYKKT